MNEDSSYSLTIMVQPDGKFRLEGRAPSPQAAIDALEATLRELRRRQVQAVADPAIAFATGNGPCPLPLKPHLLRG